MFFFLINNKSTTLFKEPLNSFQISLSNLLKGLVIQEKA